MVRFTRVNRFRVRPFARRLRTYKKNRPRRLSAAVCMALSSGSNNAGDAASIQQILTNHFPGAVNAWNHIAFKVISARELVNLFNTAFQNSTDIKLTGVMITARADPSTTLVACYRQNANDHLRVVTGVGNVKATFNFKDKVMGQYVVLLGETDATFKVTGYYEPRLLTSHL